MCTTWALPLRHAASDTAVRPALLIWARGGSVEDITVVTYGSDGRMLGNHYSSMSNVGREGFENKLFQATYEVYVCLLYTSPSPRD